jgi:hypothetical protein
LEKEAQNLFSIKVIMHWNERRKILALYNPQKELH